MIDVQGKELKLGDKVAYATAGSYDKKPALGTGYLCEIDDERGRFRVWRGLTQNKSPWIQAGNRKGVKVAKIG